MDFKDYYKTLGVEKKASAEDIQKAYRKMARKYHPDVNTDDGAEDKFKEITEAYEVLKDAEKRKQYDRFGKDWNRHGGAPPGWQNVNVDFGGAGGSSGAGFSDFFEMLFGGAGGRRAGGDPFTGFGGQGFGGQGFGGQGFGGQGFGGQGFGRPNLDQETTLALTLEEAAKGGKRQITLRDPQTNTSRTLTLNLPPGMLEGKKLRLAGKGSVAPDGTRGDLFLKIDLRPHSRLRLDGLDLHAALPVTPWQAALGAEVPIKTLDGTLRLKVPAGSSTGRKIRLRGKGYPNRKGKPGDLYAEIKVMVPETLTDRERELFEALAEESEFDAR